MAEPLKRFFDEAVVRRIARMIRGVSPEFPERRFVTDAVRGLERLELLDRARAIKEALRRALPASPPRAIELLTASLGPEQPAVPEGAGMAPFLYLPHVIFVAEHGLDCFEISMRAQYELTKRFTAEFSIRAFIDRHPDETLARLHLWAADPNVHVRRLVSEGTRPRLPWAPRLRRFQEDPRPVLGLLERLKDDPELYVRRSVANNLNDIGKDHPELLVDVCERWRSGASPEREWVIRHALRSAVKRGDRRALALLGFGRAAEVRVSGTFPRRVRLGERARLSVTVSNEQPRAQEVNVDLAVHFVKADGQARPKVFKLRALTLPAGGSAVVAKTISFEALTTRTPRAGRHRIDVLLNGQARRLGVIEVE